MSLFIFRRSLIIARPVLFLAQLVLVAFGFAKRAGALGNSRAYKVTGQFPSPASFLLQPQNKHLNVLFSVVLVSFCEQGDAPAVQFALEKNWPFSEVDIDSNHSYLCRGGRR